MKIPRIGVVTLVLWLAGCYGTMAPPPLSSMSPPAGHGASLSSKIGMPADLPGWIAVYRRALVEQKHDLPYPKAEQYADMEILSLTRRYSGRDHELKDEIARRLDALATRRVMPTSQTSTTAYPRDQISK